jgi:glycerol-3-phosphate dehydrogenase (NAD(P)+)
MNPKKKNLICVLGGGSWGSTLAMVFAKNGHDVHLWEFVPSAAELLKKTRRLKTLPQLVLPEEVIVTPHIEEALDHATVLIGAVPSHTVRSTFELVKKSGGLPKECLVVSVTKGLELESHLTMSRVINAVFPDLADIVILSGPSHAEEVAELKPVALVAAARNKEAAKRVQTIVSNDVVRVYESDDPLGVELSGSIKNIYAVACGIVDGLGLGDNTKAALQARGLVELTRLGTALGAKPMTFFGLAGLGDMIVTCNSRHSRNRLLGEKIGRGKTLEAALAEMTMVAEGVNTTKSAHFLAHSKGVEVPIINEMYKVLFQNKSPRDSIRDLMTRQLRTEMEGISL